MHAVSRQRLGRAGLLSCALLAWPGVARAQLDTQLWGNLTLDWVRSDRLAYEVDLEPKVLLNPSEGEADWWCLDVTPNVEYAAKDWLDLVAEGVVGYTRQTDDVNTWEVTPRAGARFHLLSRDVPALLDGRERPPKRRVVIRNLVRLESRNLVYTGGRSGSSSTFRFRNRLELLAPLNKEKLTKDGVRYLMADWEVYVPTSDPDERYANKQRFRVGFGYRRNFAWRYQLLYILDRSRNTIDDGFTDSSQSVDFQVKRVF